MSIKHFFKNLLVNVTVPIRKGPLAGKRWIISSGSNFLKGDFEPYKTAAFLESYKKGMVFFDIGAHIGHFSLLASDINAGEGQIFSFEPRPSNQRFFKKHMEINGAKDVTLFPFAVGQSNTKVRFNTHAGSATGHVANDGNIEVELVHLDQWVAENKLPMPDYLKIDVEGGEIEVLKGCSEMISKYHPILLVATHGPELHQFTCDFLDRNNYEYQILNPDSIKGDTEILAKWSEK